jgi:redox-sensing transcriptional repressor
VRGFRVPEVAIGRLAQYLRALNAMDLDELPARYVSSHELGPLIGVSPAQVRKDLALFGEFGKQGVGYDAANLRRELQQILNADRRIKVGLAGVGELGDALLRYNIRRAATDRDYPFVMAAAFDTDPDKIGTSVEGVTPVHSVDRLSDVVREAGLEIGIVTVPAPAAQSVADLMVAGGIRAILNFAPTKLVVPEEVRVRYSDVSLELLALGYYLGPREAKL